MSGYLKESFGHHWTFRRKVHSLRSINGLIPNFWAAGEFLGLFWSTVRTLSETPIKEMSETVGMVFQDPENQPISNEVSARLRLAWRIYAFSGAHEEEN